MKDISRVATTEEIEKIEAYGGYNIETSEDLINSLIELSNDVLKDCNYISFENFEDFGLSAFGSGNILDLCANIINFDLNHDIIYINGMGHIETKELTPQIINELMSDLDLI